MELTRVFISTLNTAISNCSLYSSEHENVEESAERVFSVLDKFPEEMLEIMLIGDDLVVNRAPVKDAGLHGRNFVKRLKRKGISRVEFLNGVAPSEIRQFIVNISQTDAEVKKFPHIRTGVTGVRLGMPDTDSEIELDDMPEFNATQSDKVKDIYSDISHFKKLGTIGLEDIVINFISTFKKEANLLKLLSPVKSYSEYTYTHATNVSVLSMFQAELLGIKGQLLYDIGIAALLHDIGKLFISNEILDKKVSLDEIEFSEMTRHTLLGAKHLIQIEGITRLAPIVALEHHRKYDGTGYPAINGNGRSQHIFSQIVAISDFFDAMRSWRPYRHSWQTKDIITIMKKHSGTDFNPFLLDNFIRMLHTALSQ